MYVSNKWKIHYRLNINYFKFDYLDNLIIAAQMKNSVITERVNVNQFKCSYNSLLAVQK